MEESIGKLCNSMAGFCNHLDSSCDALKQSVDRRPIPLDSASSTFVNCLNRRVSSTSSDLNLLESMSFGTVSFEELLGHCNEVYKKNQTDMLELQERLTCFGYVPQVETDELEEEVWNDPHPSISVDLKTMEDDSLFEDSMSLQNLGLSDASLATIVSEADCQTELKGLYEPATKILEVTEGEAQDESKSFEDSKSVIDITKDDYENLPSYMKSLASWEDLLGAVEKMNSSLKGKLKGHSFFDQDEIASLELGHKSRSYLLLLVRMNRLFVETKDGLISYRVL